MIGSSTLQAILAQIAGTRASRYSTTTVPGGNTVANTTAETAFTSSYAIPAGSVTVGDVLTIECSGVFSATALAPTLQGKLKLGPTVVLDTGALAGLVNGTNLAWNCKVRLHVVAVGASGSVECGAALSFATAANAALAVNLHTTAPITIDWTVAQAITLTATWSAASASNSITVRMLSVW